MPDDVKSKIAELEKQLYAKEFKPRPTEEILTRKVSTVAPDWDREADAESLLKEQVLRDARHKKMKTFVKFSIGFFVLAVCIAAFIWWKGVNLISGGNIDINISAPVSVAGGEPFETTFLITNRNKVSIEAATLLAEYPEGFYAADKTSLPRISKDLGVIAPGQSVTETVDSTLYGEQNTSKDVAVTLEYRLAGSNATLNKATTYTVKILSSPVNVQLNMPTEASSGQSVDFSIDVTSNSQNPLNPLLVNATYPSGFTFGSASPAPTYGTNTWLMSPLAPQEKRTITVHGTMEGVENEEKVTKIAIGTQSATNEQSIDVIYNATTESMTITKPFVGLSIDIDGDYGADHVVSQGRDVKADVYWQNNDPSEITDATIQVKLAGNALDRYQIYASSGGFYRSVDNTIVWDKSGAPELGTIEPGAKGSVSFGFAPVALGINAGSIINNPEITLEVNVTGHRSSSDTATQNVTTFASRTVKFETDLELATEALHYSGPFTNTGPMPPKVETETTYTIDLSTRNSVNDVSNVVAKTTLPIYVKWLGAISPPGEDLTYDETTNEVTWNVGRITAGGQRDVAFQVSLLPSLSQVRQAPQLTGPVSLTGTDDFTKTTLQSSKPAMTTALYSDPQFVQEDADVVN